MECDNSKARRDVYRNAAGQVPFVWQHVRARAVRVDDSPGLPRASPVPPLRAAPAAPFQLPPDAPFMNDMDEITYWVHTKRAPCLLNYDNPIKKRSKAQSSKEPCSVTEEVRSPKKKKKRKLSLLDDSISSEGRQNVYFETQNKTRQSDNRCKPDSLGSDVDFNIKKTSVQEKSKKPKLQKSNRTTIHKKNKVVTSTPKATTHLRRSLRHNKGVNHHLNNSFEILNTSVSNGNHHNVTPGKQADRLNTTALLAGGDQTPDKKRNNLRNKSHTPARNGHVDDMSDVSGFTANYIRSTKVQSSKQPRNIRCKSGRNLVKEAQKTENESNMVVTMNKSVNTGIPNNILNCSTDSSQNLINLVTTKDTDLTVKVDKSTSLLKFVDMKTKGKEKGDEKKATNLNISFQSQSSRASRYPKRNKTPTTTITTRAALAQSSDTRTSKNFVEFNNSDKKENPGEELMSKTRSGRNIGLSLMQRENTVLVVSNSTEPVSSKVSLNVASQTSRKKRTPVKQARSKKGTYKVQSPRRDSLRDKSGFAACFSESDDDSEPLVQRKYFCP